MVEHKHNWVVKCSYCNEVCQDPLDHFVTFKESHWFIEHSFACRISGRMTEGCEYQKAIENILDSVEPGDYGRWKITYIDEGLPSMEGADND